MTTINGRASQVVTEVQLLDLSNARMSQVVVEAGTLNGSNFRASQAVLEVGSFDTSRFLASQTVAEIHLRDHALLRASQIVVEVLILGLVPGMPEIYPTLIGLTYNVIKRPKFSNGVGVGTSGAEIRVGYWNTPLWEWDLIYEYLPDKPANGTTESDLKALMGFYLSTQGGLQGFLFEDPDDCMVVNQGLGTGDGVTQSFQFQRTFGNGGLGSAGTGTEYIGYLNSAVPIEIYDNGVLVSPADYDIVYTAPNKMYVIFGGPPVSGAVITATFGYYFYVRFKDDTLDFEKFMDKLWDNQRVTLCSLRNQ